MSLTAAPVARRRNRHHAAFLEALLRGDPVEAVAKGAGVHRRTVQRWKVEHAAELDAARESLVAAALNELRAGLLSAARRLRREAEDLTNGSVGVRAALGLLSAHHDLALIQDYGTRLTALEARGP